MKAAQPAGHLVVPTVLSQRPESSNIWVVITRHRSESELEGMGTDPFRCPEKITDSEPQRSLQSDVTRPGTTRPFTIDIINNRLLFPSHTAIRSIIT